MAIIKLDASVRYAVESSFGDGGGETPTWKVIGSNARVTSFREEIDYGFYLNYGSRIYAEAYSRGFRGSLSKEWIVTNLDFWDDLLGHTIAVEFTRGSYKLLAKGVIPDTIGMRFEVKEVVRATMSGIFKDITKTTGASPASMDVTGAKTWLDVSFSGISGIKVTSLDFDVRNNPTLYYVFGSEKADDYYLGELVVEGTIRGAVEDDTAIDTLLNKTATDIVITVGSNTITLSDAVFLNVDDSIDVASADPLLRRGIRFRAKNISVA